MTDLPFSAASEDRTFREHFGCCAEVAMIAWNFLEGYDFLPTDGTIEHLLWALMFLKVYAKTGPMRTLCGGIDNETMMKYIWPFIYGLAYLEQFLVRMLLLGVPVDYKQLSHACPALRLSGRIDIRLIVVVIALSLLMGRM